MKKRFNNTKSIFWLFLLPTVFFLINNGNTQTLTVSAGNNSHSASNEFTDGIDLVTLQVQLSADGVDDIVITSITVDPVTSADISTRDIASPDIKLYDDVNHNGFLDEEDEFIASRDYAESEPTQIAAPVSITIPDIVINANSSKSWIFVQSYWSDEYGDYIQLNATGVSANALSTGSPATVTGTPVTGTTKTIRQNYYNGNLFIGEGGHNPVDRNVSAGATDEVMIQTILATSTLRSATITSISFDMSGTGDESTDLLAARLYYDGDGNGILNLASDTQIGSEVTSFANDGVLTFSGISETIPAGTAQNWMVLYDFNSSQATSGETFTLTLTNNADITSANITKSDAPASSGTATISATGTLTLSLGSDNPVGHKISASENNLAMMQLKLSANSTEDIDISEVSFDTNGSADESTDIDSVRLFLDMNSNGKFDIAYDTQIGATQTSFTDNGLITFSSLSETINSSSSEEWLLVFDLAGNASAGETFGAFINSTSYITAIGATSSNSVSPAGLPVNGNSMNVSATGTLTMALASNNPGDVDINGPVSNLTMMAFTLTANDVEDITIDSIIISPTTLFITTTDIEDNDVRLYEDIDQNGLLNLAVDRFIADTNYTLFGNQNDINDATLRLYNEVIAANSTVQYIITHTFTTVNTNEYFQILIDNNGAIGATGNITGNPAYITGAILDGGIKNVVAGTAPGHLSISAGTENPAYRYIPKGTQNEVMLQLQIGADPIEDIDISAIRFVTTGTGDESTDVDSVRLFLDGDDNGLFNSLYDTQLGLTISSFSDDTLDFTGLTETISNGNSENWILVYNFNSVNNVVNETFQVGTGNTFLTATGATSSQSITPTGGPVDGGMAVISDNGTLTVSAGANNPSATNVGNADNNVVAIQMNIAAGSNEDVTISAITFTMSGTFDDTLDFEDGTFRLFDDDNGNGALDGGENQIGTGQNASTDNGMVTFSGLSETILAGTDVNWIVLVNLNGAASNSENFRVSFTNNLNMTATGDITSNTIYPEGTPVHGGLFTVGATGSLTLTLGSNNPSTGTENPGAQSVEMLQLKLSASGVEDIKVTSITFTADGTGDDLADLNDSGNGVSLYLDVNNDGQLDGGDSQIDVEGTYTADNGTITFSTTTDTITAGTSENWLVVYDFDAGATNGTTFRLGIYNASQITSTGVTSGNPITETGFPKVSSYKTITTVGTMSLFAGDFNPGVANIDTPINYEMLQIKLAVSTIEAIDIENLTITHIGTGDPVNDIATNGVRLVRDNNNNGTYDNGTDDILASTNYSGTTATFTLSPDSILADDTENWLVTYDFVMLTVGETYRARIANLTDLSLTGRVSSQPITANGSVPISGGTMTVDNDFGLPVELTSFVAKGDYGFINLKWVTESEINNLGFSVERKLASDEDFELIASYTTVESLSGSGNSSSQSEYSFNDSTVIPDKEYTYRLLQHDYNGRINVQQILASAIAKEPLPTEFGLAQNYPNPFNPETTIKIGLPEQSKVKITIYNILGQEILTLINKNMEAGYHKLKWDGANRFGAQTSSGLYFCVLQIKTLKGKTISKNRKMIKLK